MRKITFTRSFAAPLAAAVLLGAVLLPATAREGSARSVGNGVKCYTVAVKNADGTVTYTQVCRKGV